MTYLVKLQGTLNGVQGAPVVPVIVEDDSWVMLHTLETLSIEKLTSDGYKNIDVKLKSVEVVG